MTHDVPSQLAWLDLLKSDEIDGITAFISFNIGTASKDPSDSLVGTNVTGRKTDQQMYVRHATRAYDSKTRNPSGLSAHLNSRGDSKRTDMKVAVHTPAKIPYRAEREISKGPGRCLLVLPSASVVRFPGCS